VLGLVAVAGALASFAAEAPLALHPQNPHYFLFRGKPTVLVTSGEHYGAVLNADFDYVTYLKPLEKDGLNLTRTFSGAYVEPPGAFNIANNTLAPAKGRFLAPWARSEQPGYANGGAKFDLSRWSPEYFSRLRAFVGEARRRGVVVEMNLFCPFYDEAQWAISPMNAANNINGLGTVARTNVYTMDRHGGLLAVHEALTRKLVTELNSFDNVYYEVCNEPYFGGVSLYWQHHIAETIVDAERALPFKHLISRNVNNGREKVTALHPAFSILNFHYATPPDTVGMNYGLGRVIGDNETGFAGTNNLPYRIEAWEFMLAGGGLFNNLDYSFAAGFENGTFAYPASQPGGGNPLLRKQFATLKRFLEAQDFVRMAPDTNLVRSELPPGVRWHALSRRGQAYALYLCRPPRKVDKYSVRWTGELTPRFSETYTLHVRSDDGVRLWVDDQLLIDAWEAHPVREDKATVELRSGRPVALRLEYFQSGDGAEVRLSWSSTSQKAEIIPAVCLRPAHNAPHFGLKAAYFTGTDLNTLGFERVDPQVDFDWAAESPFSADAPPGAVQPTHLTVDLPEGKYRTAWLDPETGKSLGEGRLDHLGGTVAVAMPPLRRDLAFSIRRSGKKR